MTSPDTTKEVPLLAYVEPATTVATYYEMGEAPSSAGGLRDRLTCASPASPATSVGGCGSGGKNRRVVVACCHPSDGLPARTPAVSTATGTADAGVADRTR